MDKILEQIGENAAASKLILQNLTTEEKNHALKRVSEHLIEKADYIIEQNKIDIENGKKANMNEGLLDRLLLNLNRIEGIAEGITEVIKLEDPIGEILDESVQKNGLHITKVRVPFGVIGIIYEARPNVTADAFALCFKTGNAVILKGGSAAINSNKAITLCIREALIDCNIDKNAIQLIESTDREITNQFIKMKEYVDLLIPRGSASLIKLTVENSLIPVIETGTGNCHIFVDESADIDKSIPIIINAKTQRIGVCNACESLVIHEKICQEIMPRLKEALFEKNVEIRGDKRIIQLIPEDCILATEQDYSTEYLDLILSIKTVSNLDEAIKHINKCSTGHSDAILTENRENAEKFQRLIDSACVYVNTSTRFTDGFEFGLGAEIGISTQKLHARGPMGLKEITSYKYYIESDWQYRK